MSLNRGVPPRGPCPERSAARIAGERSGSAVATAKRWRTAALLALAAAAVGAPAAAGAGASAGLIEPFLAGDDAELARVARLASTRGVRAALTGSDRVGALAGTEAAPHVEDAWELLDALAVLAGGADRPLAIAAAVSAARIAGPIDITLALDRAMPPDALRRFTRAWAALAARADRWPDVRVLALQIAAALARATPPDGERAGYDLSAAATDPDPEVRRAALELLPSPLSTDQLGVASRALASDRDPIVALAAAQAACAGIAFGDPRPPIVAALGDTGIARVRELVADTRLSSPARRDAALCLDARAKPEPSRARREAKRSRRGPRGGRPRGKR